MGSCISMTKIFVDHGKDKNIDTKIYGTSSTNTNYNTEFNYNTNNVSVVYNSKFHESQKKQDDAVNHYHDTKQNCTLSNSIQILQTANDFSTNY